MLVGYPHDSKTLWRIWVAESQKMIAQSAVLFDKERHEVMSCQRGSNEIDIYGVPENEEYVEESDTRDEPLQGQDSQPMQIPKRSTSLMHGAPDEQAKNAHSRHLRRDNQTAQHSAADAETFPSRRLRCDDQTAQRSARDEENITQSQHLCTGDQTSRHSAAAIETSSQLPPASPAPPLASLVTRSEGRASAEALTVSIEGPFTHVVAMESPQRDHWNREESTLILLNNTFSTQLPGSTATAC